MEKKLKNLFIFLKKLLVLLFKKVYNEVYMIKNKIAGLQQKIQSIQNHITVSSSNIILWILGALVIIGPLVWIPGGALSAIVGKTFIVILSVFAMVLLYGIHVLRTGAMVLPNHLVFKSLGLLIVFGFISVLFAPSAGMSFWGYGFETTTWLFVTVFGICIFLASQMIRTKDQLGGFVVGIMIPVVVVMILHTLRFVFGADFAHMYVLRGVTDSIVGSWSDVSLLLTLGIIISTLSIQLGALHKTFKIILGIIALYATMILIASNAMTALMITGFITLLGILYTFSFAYWNNEEKTYSKKRVTPWVLLASFIILIAGIFVAPSMSSLVARHQDITIRDTRPSFQGTLSAGIRALQRNFVTGYGPNTFSSVWNRAQPVSISGTPLSTREFSLGLGYIPTHMATGGISATILWVLFSGILLMVVIKKMTQGYEKSFERHVISLSGLVIITGLVSMWFYVPGTSLLIIYAIITGGFLGVLISDKDIHEKKVSFMSDPRISFFGILGIIIVMMITLAGSFFMVRKMSSWVRYSQAESLFSRGFVPEGSQKLLQAIGLSGHDVYYQRAADLSLQQIKQILQKNSTLDKDQLSQQVEQSLGSALGYAQQAIAVHSLNYKNHVLLGMIYQTMTSLGITDAYGNAVQSFQEAVVRNPQDSTMTLLFADLALVNKNTPQALEYIQQSINQYPTRGAYVLRSQIEISQQKWASAIMSLNEVLRYTPTDVITYITLGVVYEKSGDSVNAQKIYTTIKRRFTDGEVVIQKIKSNFGVVAPAEPEASEDASTDIVAPNQKKQ